MAFIQNIAMVLGVLILASVSALPATATVNSLKDLEVPLHGLPAPDGLTLKYIGLGLGTHNYTCATNDSTGTSIGAMTTIYDLTSLASTLSANNSGLAERALSMNSTMGLPKLGQHWHNSAFMPTFSLDYAKPPAYLSAPDVVSVKAPSDSTEGSISWQYLSYDNMGTSENLKAVYRVNTAGGKMLGKCSKAGSHACRYAALYWFYT